MSTSTDSRLAHFDNVTAEMERQVANARETLQVGKEAFLAIRDRGGDRDKNALDMAAIAVRLTELECNIGLLEGLIKENQASRATLVALLEESV